MAKSKAYRPTLGIALSGSGSRSVFYIGFLEALHEEGLKPDYLSACSGATIAAAAYACGTLPRLKDYAFNFSREELKKLLGPVQRSGGLYSLDAVEHEMRAYTNGARFEDVKPHMAFMAADIETGSLVTMAMGDIARAVRISCTLPGVFEPVRWGSKTLIDGGLLAVVPVQPLRAAGADVVVGVNMMATEHIFHDSLKTFRRVWNYVKRVTFLDYLNGFVEAYLSEDDLTERLTKQPKVFTVLGRSLDLAIAASRNPENRQVADYEIVPDFPKSNRLGDIDDSQRWYAIGRKVAQSSIPQIRRLIADRTTVSNNVT